MFGPASSGQAVIDTTLAAREHLRPGSILHLIGIPKGADGSADLKLAVPLSFRVAAVGVFDDQIVGTTTDGHAAPGAAVPGVRRHRSGRRDD